MQEVLEAYAKTVTCLENIGMKDIKKKELHATSK